MRLAHLSCRRAGLLAACLLMVLGATARRAGAGELPLTRIRSGHLTVGAMVNGASVRLVVDTACPVTIIGRAASERLKLSETGSRTATGVARLHSLNGQPASIRYADSLVIGGVDAGPRRVAVTSLDAVLGSQFGGWGSSGADGILGADLLAAHRAVVDVGRGTLTLDRPPATRNDPAWAGHTAVRLSVTNRGHVAVPCIIGDDPARLVVDTGSPFTVVRRGAVDPADLAQPRRISLMRTLSGVTPVVWVPLRHWNIGNFPVSDTRVGVGDFRGGIFTEHTRSGGQVDGLLGLEWLTQWQAVVDFGAGAVYLKHR